MSTDHSLEPASDFAERTRLGFMKKATHNKRESLMCFGAVVFCTLVAPLFVTLGEGIVLAKIIPSSLSLLAAASTAWLQLRKPQQLWALYRDCQRRIEDHQTQYQYGIEEYEDETDRERRLADNVRQIAWDAHVRWVPLVPSPETLGHPTKKPISLIPGREDVGRKN
jgi:hypothetical protein